MGEDRTDRPSPDLDRVTVAQAAAALKISQDAVRKRIARGTIPHDRDESGRVYVYLATSETVHKTGQDSAHDDGTKPVQDAFIRRLENQIAFLRRELERKDTILLNLTERIAELETPLEAPENVEPASNAVEVHESTEEASEAPEAADAQQGRGLLPHSDAPGAQEGVQRPWWRRVLGG